MKSDYKIGCTKCGKYLEGKTEAGVFDIFFESDEDHPDILKKICTCPVETEQTQTTQTFAIEWQPIIDDLEKVQEGIAHEDYDVALKRVQEISLNIKELKEKSDKNAN